MTRLCVSRSMRWSSRGPRWRTTLTVWPMLMLALAGCVPVEGTPGGARQEPLGKLTAESPCPSPAVEEGRLPSTDARACLLSGRRLSLTLMGSGTCKPRPVNVQARRTLLLVVRPDGGQGDQPCTSDLAPAHTTLRLPEGLAVDGALRAHAVERDGLDFWLVAKP